MDVWALILRSSDPKTISQARYINRGFRDLLKYQSVWTEFRLNFFGNDVPSPPNGLSEFQYVDLLAGTGCMSCGIRTARKVYWAFLRRWCRPCFMAKTIKASSAEAIVAEYPGLLDCILRATVDPWGGYEGAGGDSEPSKSSAHGRRELYLKQDVTKILVEYENFLSSLPQDLSTRQSDKQEKQWRHARAAIVLSTLEERNAIERWIRQRRTTRDLRNREIRTSREEFFKQHAMLLEPPLTEFALGVIGAYQSSVKITKPPSEKSWNALVPKLEDARAAAERIEAEETRARDNNQWDHHKAVQEARQRRVSADQKFVLEIADHVLVKLMPRLLQGTMCVQDFVLSVFRCVWTCYQSFPVFLRPMSPLPESIHPDGRYSLTVDDACMVMDKKIMPALKGLPKISAKAAYNLKCPGCTRNDINHRFTFKELLVHIRDAHAQKVGDFQSFRKAGSNAPFAWCAVPWTANLPALAEHHKSLGTWDPESALYLSTSIPVSMEPVAPSAFSGRQVSNNSFDIAAEPEDFVGNVKDVSVMLRGSPLESRFKTKIALQYSLQRYKTWASNQAPWYCPIITANQSYSPNFAACEELPLELIRIGEFDLFNNLRCKTCREEKEAARTQPSKFASFPQTLSKLIHHYKSYSISDPDHDLNAWATNLFDVPSDEDLWHAISSPEMVATRVTFDKLFPPRTRCFSS